MRSYVPPKVLFFSRGRGRGHAFRDIFIIKQLKLVIDVDITIISYGSGARAFEAFGYPVVDLELPESNPLLQMIVIASRQISEREPHLIVAHEEFAAAVAAAGYSKSSIFITDWFVDPDDLRMRALSYCSEILFLEEPGIFTEPPYLRDKISYTGPIVREFLYSRADKAKARTELGINQDEVVVGCLPGSTSEMSTPIVGLLLEAFDRLPYPNKRLLWVDQTSYDVVRSAVASRKDVTLLRSELVIERIMVACDIAVCKCTRNTLRELNSLGIPSVSLSHGKNWIDDILAARLPTNTPLDVRQTKPDDLARELQKGIQMDQDSSEIAAPVLSTGLQGVVDRLAHHVREHSASILLSRGES